MDFTDQKKVALEDLKHQIKTNFLNLAKAYFSDVIENSKTGNACIEDLKNYKNKPDFPFWKKFIFDITEWQNRIFTLLAVLLSAWFLYFRKEKIYLFVALFIGYIIVLSGISCGQGDRFPLVIFPFVILILAKFLSDNKRFKPFFEPLQK